MEVYDAVKPLTARVAICLSDQALREYAGSLR